MPYKMLDEYRDTGLDAARKLLAQIELVTGNPQMNQNVSFPWLKEVCIHIEMLYRLIKDLQIKESEDYNLLQQLLSADKSVPKEELAARAELLGLFVKALRDRTTQGGVSP